MIVFKHKMTARANAQDSETVELDQNWFINWAKWTAAPRPQTCVYGLW